MTDQSQGFCKECRKSQFEQSGGIAHECGHQTVVAGMKFCLACSIKFLVCRSCGGYLIKGEENKE